LPESKESEILSVKMEETTPVPQSTSQKSERSKPLSTRPKSTLNLNAILRAKELAPDTLPQVEEPVDVKPLTDEELRGAWSDYAQLRKSQVAEFHLLSRTVDVQGSTVTVALANSVEEPLLQTILPDLLTYLRNRLSNPGIRVESVMKEAEAKKIAYTNKEKFDLLVEKNPLLKELKERLGLDPDF
jgi:hypothetical protein